jgi:hypothetical protein
MRRARVGRKVSLLDDKDGQQSWNPFLTKDEPRRIKKLERVYTNGTKVERQRRLWCKWAQEAPFS